MNFGTRLVKNESSINTMHVLWSLEPSSLSGRSKWRLLHTSFTSFIGQKQHIQSTYIFKWAAFILNKIYRCNKSFGFQICDTFYSVDYSSLCRYWNMIYHFSAYIIASWILKPSMSVQILIFWKTSKNKIC